MKAVVTKIIDKERGVTIKTTPVEIGINEAVVFEPVYYQNSLPRYGFRKLKRFLWFFWR